MKKRIHVNRHNIAWNKKHATKWDDERPPFTVKTYKRNYRSFYVEILGKVELVYNPDKPLSCGAVAWMETDDAVIVWYDGHHKITI